MPASIIFEAIKGEMDYVRDLENIEVVSIRPICSTPRVTVD